MNDARLTLWPRLDALRPVFSQREVRAWPANEFERLVAAGWLRQVENASTIACPQCDSCHVEEVVARRQPDGGHRFFIYCPETLRLEIHAKDLTTWGIDSARVATALAGALALSGKVMTLVPFRLWRLGRGTWRGVLCDVIFACGLSSHDGGELQHHIGRAHRPLVLVPHQIPPADRWRRRVPAIISLSQAASFSAGVLRIDPLEITAAWENTTTEGTVQTAVATDVMKLMIRQQIKAEGSSHLTDDAFKSAYRQYGSIRAAAEFLSEQIGRNISKDQVGRAITRCGGRSGVAAPRDTRGPPGP